MAHDVVEVGGFPRASGRDREAEVRRSIRSDRRHGPQVAAPFLREQSRAPGCLNNTEWFASGCPRFIDNAIAALIWHHPRQRRRRAASSTMPMPSIKPSTNQAPASLMLPIKLASPAVQSIFRKSGHPVFRRKCDLIGNPERFRFNLIGKRSRVPGHGLGGFESHDRIR